MAAPRITIGATNLDLIMGKNGLTQIHRQRRNQNESASGKIETINIFGRYDYEFDAYFTNATYLKLVAWWSWARQGKEWAFALDSDNVGSTTLDAAAANGQKTIPLTATAAFTVGDNCLIRALDNDDEFEIIEIDSINAGVSVDAVDNLYWPYTSGDSFTHLDYFPTVVTTETEFRPTLTGVKDKTSRYYKHVFKFTESL